MPTKIIHANLIHISTIQHKYPWLLHRRAAQCTHLGMAINSINFCTLLICTVCVMYRDVYEQCVFTHMVYIYIAEAKSPVCSEQIKLTMATIYKITEMFTLRDTTPNIRLQLGCIQFTPVQKKGL